VWAPGGTLVIDWGWVHVFCAVLAWSRAVMRFADNERAQTTLAMQARVDAVGTAWRRQLVGAVDRDGQLRRAPLKSLC
jgi:hypothetical protein